MSQGKTKVATYTKVVVTITHDQYEDDPLDWVDVGSWINSRLNKQPRDVWGRHLHSMHIADYKEDNDVRTRTT